MACTSQGRWTGKAMMAITTKLDDPSSDYSKQMILIHLPKCVCISYWEISSTSKTDFPLTPRILFMGIYSDTAAKSHMTHHTNNVKTHKEFYKKKDFSPNKIWPYLRQTIRRLQPCQQQQGFITLTCPLYGRYKFTSAAYEHAKIF